METKKCVCCKQKKFIEEFPSEELNHKTCFECLKRYQNKRIIKKTLAVKLKGGKCNICGYNKNLSALDFHHPNNREIERGKSFIYFSLEDMKKEVQKCILLCRNCHAEIHNPDHEIKNSEAEDFGFELPSYRCLVCKKVLWDLDNDKYCSKECAAIGTRKTEWPSQEELVDMLANKESMCSIGRKYGVSDNAVRKWIKKYNIKTKGE